MRDAGQSVQTQVSIQAGAEESRCWSLRCFQLWDKNLLLETNCSTFCFPQTSSLPLLMTEMSSCCAEFHQWTRLHFLSCPCTEPLPTHRGIQVIRDPHAGVSLAESLDFWRHPCRWFPSSPLCWGHLLLVGLDLWGWFLVYSCGLHCALVSAAELQKPTCTFTLHGKPFLQRHWTLQILSWVLQSWLCTSPWCWDVLAQSTMGFLAGFAAVILSPYWAFLSGVFFSLVSLTALITYC